MHRPFENRPIFPHCSLAPDAVDPRGVSPTPPTASYPALGLIRCRESTPPRAKARQAIRASGYVASTINMRDVEDHCGIRCDRGDQSAHFRRIALRWNSGCDKADNGPLPSGLRAVGYECTQICADDENSNSHTSCCAAISARKNTRFRSRRSIATGHAIETIATYVGNGTPPFAAAKTLVGYRTNAAGDVFSRYTCARARRAIK